MLLTTSRSGRGFLILLSLMISFHSTAWARTEAKNPTEVETLSHKATVKPNRLLGDKVLHFGIIKPSSTFDVEQTDAGVKTTGDVSMDKSVGFGAGISYLPLQSLGWDVQLSHVIIDQSPVS